MATTPANKRAQSKAECCACCNDEVQLPGTILAREAFCDVNSHNRKCTDTLCCLVFLVFLAAWGVVCFVGLHYGELLSLVYARDYRGRVCGTGDFVDRTRTYYPRLKDDLLQYAFDTVEGFTTGEAVDLTNLEINFEELQLTGICVESCPHMRDLICTPEYVRRVSVRHTSGAACMHVAIDRSVGRSVGRSANSKTA